MSPPESIIIGIDNGLSGGIVAIDRGTGAILRMSTMPALAGIRELDGVQIIDWIRDTICTHRAVCAIERCPDHADQASTMRSMGISHGILFGCIRTIRAVRVVSVTSGTQPKESWQRRLFGLLKGGETKNAAIAMAGRLWPAETWIPSKRHSIPHTGLIDAALIAHFIRTENL